MSQHDFDIATDDANTGVTFRAAVNAALQALASCNSGPSEPAITWAGMLWYDTTTDALKQRDSTNTAWNEVWKASLSVSAFAYTILDDTTAGAARVTLGGADPPGVIKAYGGDTAPSGWLLCYGQAVSRTTYADLFAIIGEKFGAGDASTTFNLPDCRGRFLLGKDNMGGSSADRVTDSDADTIGGAHGDETKDISHTHAAGTLTTPALSLSTHTVSMVSSGIKCIIDGDGDIYAPYSGGVTQNNTVPKPSISSGASVAGSTASGGSATQDIMPPFLTVNYIIKI